MSDLEFRRLEPDDMVLLHKWLNMPHMRAFYQKNEISLDEVRKRYLPRTAAGSTTRCHIAELDGVPIGKLQCYRNLDYPEYALEIQVSTGTSIDLFIGEARMLSRGFCRPMLERYLQIVAEEFPGESEVFVCHHRNNVAAIECSKSVGFRYLRDVVESGVPSVLLSIPLPLEHREEIEKEMLPNTRLEQTPGASLAGGCSTADQLYGRAAYSHLRQTGHMTIEELERAIEALPPDELAKFRAWFIEYDFAAWDRQIERDTKAGKLDALADEAVSDHKSGRTTLL